MLPLSQDMERTMNLLFADIDFGDWPLLDSLIVTYENMFLDFLNHSFVAQLYPTIYGDAFPDIHLQNVFPPAKPAISLAGESKFTYEAINGYNPSPLHARLSYIRRNRAAHPRPARTSTIAAITDEDFQQVIQNKPLGLPFTNKDAEKTYLQGFPAKRSAALKMHRTQAQADDTQRPTKQTGALTAKGQKTDMDSRTFSRTLSSAASVCSSVHSTRTEHQSSPMGGRFDSLSHRSTSLGSEVYLGQGNCHSSPQTNSNRSSVATVQPANIGEHEGTLTIQATYRMLMWRTWFITTRLAALVIQGHYRGIVARESYAKRRIEAADQAARRFQRGQATFINELYSVGAMRRTSSLTYDAFIFAKHKFNEPIVSYFMPVCYDRIERILFDSARSQQYGSLELRDMKYTIPIMLMSTPASIDGTEASLFNSYSTPSKAFSFCMLSILHFLLDPTVAHLIVVAEHHVPLFYIEAILDSISQESMLLKRNHALTGLLRAPSPRQQRGQGSPMRTPEILSITPGPQPASPSPIPRPSDIANIDKANAHFRLPSRLGSLVKDKLTVIHPSLLRTLGEDLAEMPVKFTYTGSVASLLLLSPDTVEKLHRAIDRAYLDIVHRQRSLSRAAVIPYFISNIDNVSDYDLYALTSTFRASAMLLTYNQRIDCRDYVLTCINNSKLFSVESIAELHKYLRYEEPLKSDTEYILAPFIPGMANVFSDAVLYSLAGMRSYIIARETVHSRCISLQPVLPVTDVEQPHARIAEKICSSLRLGDYYILSIGRKDAQRVFIAARLIVYIELADNPVVTYLGSCVDISTTIPGTSLPTRSFGTIYPAPNSVYLVMKKKSGEAITKLIGYGVFGIVTLHYLYSEDADAVVRAVTSIDGISLQSYSMHVASGTVSPSLVSPLAQSVSISPAPRQGLSVKDYTKIYDSEVAHFNSLLSPTTFGKGRTKPLHSSMNTASGEWDTTNPSASEAAPDFERESTVVLVNISFGFTPSISHMHTAMALADLSWDSIHGVLSRNDTSLLKKRVVKTPMVILSLPFLWHRDMQTLDRSSFMAKLMGEGIAFDSFTRTGTLFDWNPKSASFGVFGVYRDPLLAVQRMIRLLDITLSAVHSAHSTSVSSVTTKLNSLHCESEVNGKTYAHSRTLKMSTNILDCGAALKAMVPYLQVEKESRRHRPGDIE